MRFLGIALHQLENLGVPKDFPALFTGGSCCFQYCSSSPAGSKLTNSPQPCTAYARYIQIRDMTYHTTGSLILLEEMTYK